MYGTLKIAIGVQHAQYRRLVTVYRKQCTRAAADEEVTMFKALNPGLEDAITEITWQAEREWL